MMRRLGLRKSELLVYSLRKFVANNKHFQSGGRLITRQGKKRGNMATRVPHL